MYLSKNRWIILLGVKEILTKFKLLLLKTSLTKLIINNNLPLPRALKFEIGGFSQYLWVLASIKLYVIIPMLFEYKNL